MLDKNEKKRLCKEKSDIRRYMCTEHRYCNEEIHKIYQPLPTLAATVSNPDSFVLKQGFLHNFQFTANRVAWVSPTARFDGRHE